ncbi:hypothetical protein DFP93_10790 [Aneurinibacillus soli]|uniref:Uncharacterized protein n=1 Tax=Aneurinibacillus soli TaxID=1500254 RepID=A0A0U5AXG9_9BACL|nr:hypothetical protein DFP93_10790 [Aneurinibacillus soli]BAU28442.1 hypothetical protein CB4_02616 [Aneurinibacillus soli]
MDSSSRLMFEQLKRSIRILCNGKARFLFSFHIPFFAIISVSTHKTGYDIS